MPPDGIAPSAGDAAYLRDMIDACARIERFVSGRTLDHYRADDMLRSAVERQIEIIGEAARHVSEPFRAARAEIPWRPIMAQRHILAHEYGEIEDPLIWRVATFHIPALHAQLKSVVLGMPDTGASKAS